MGLLDGPSEGLTEEGSLDALTARLMGSKRRLDIPPPASPEVISVPRIRIKNLPFDPKLSNYNLNEYESVVIDLPRSTLIEIFELSTSLSKAPDEVISEILTEGLGGAYWLPTYLLRMRSVY